VPDAIPTRVTGTDPVSEFDEGVPASPTPIPTRTYAIATCQYGVLSAHRRSIVRNASSSPACPNHRVFPDPGEWRTRYDYTGVMGEDDGGLGCMSLLACHDVGPKDLPLATQIAFMRRKMVSMAWK